MEAGLQSSSVFTYALQPRDTGEEWVRQTSGASRLEAYGMEVEAIKYSKCTAILSTTLALT